MQLVSRRSNHCNPSTHTQTTWLPFPFPSPLANIHCASGPVTMWPGANEEANFHVVCDNWVCIVHSKIFKKLPENS